MAWRLRGYQELQRLGRIIAHLVGHARLDLDLLLCAQALNIPVELEGRSAGEHEQELAGVLVRVANLNGARRHALVDDAQRGVAQ